MLPELTLDKESFEEIMDEARNMIISLYPEWTDFNYHDPGITLIEMFSWLKESQQFFLDQISDESREKYLKLLGMKRRHRAPSAALVRVKAPEDVAVLRGTKLLAGTTCFMAERRTQLIGGDIRVCFSAGEDGPGAAADRARLAGDHSLGLELFGREPREGDCFYIGFDRMLPEAQELSIYMELEESGTVARNPLEGDMPFPLAVLELQYFGETGWETVLDFRDGTRGAVATGFLEFSIHGPQKETELWGRAGYFLRLVLKRQSFDTAPVLRMISADVLSLRQAEQRIEKLDVPVELTETGENCCLTDTMLSLNGKNELYALTGELCVRVSRFTKTSNFDTGVSRFLFTLPQTAEPVRGIRVISFLDEDAERGSLAVGTGFPFQEYDLADGDVEYHSFELMVRDSGCGPHVCSLWTKVDDLSGSGPADRHYVLDAERGLVRFGDCIHGLAPQGEILIAAYERTLGRRGNAKACAIDRFDGLEPEDMRVWNWDNCRGGRDEESLAECFLRARKMLKTPETAVSDQDYERRVMETPGLMLESCKVISSREMRLLKKAVDETEINIVVKPFSRSGESGLSSAYKNNILNYLEQFRMAGRRISLLPPRYIEFEVYADIVVRPHFVGARELVEQTVSQYFARIGNQFGATVQYADFYGALDVLPCVAGINSLTMDASGNGVTRSKDGAVRLPPNGVVRLGNVQYLFSMGE